MGQCPIPRLDDIGSARINVHHIQYGVEIENIEAEFNLADPGIHFDSLEGVFLGSQHKGRKFSV